MIEKLKGKILLAVFRELANKISPMSFSSIFIGFRVIVSNKFRVGNKLILYVIAKTPDTPQLVPEVESRLTKSQQPGSTQNHNDSFQQRLPPR